MKMSFPWPKRNVKAFTFSNVRLSESLLLLLEMSIDDSDCMSFIVRPSFWHDIYINDQINNISIILNII